MQSLKVAVIEKSEIAAQWVELGFKILSSKLRVEYSNFPAFEDFLSNQIEFDIVVLGSSKTDLGLEEMVKSMRTKGIFKDTPCFYMCNKMSEKQTAILTEDLFSGIWEKVHTSSKDVAQDVLNSIQVPYLIFNQSLKQKITKCLVVDDALISQKVAVKLVQNLGFETDKANNGTVGVRKAKEFEPDMILMDFEMPEMNGLICTERVKAKSPDTIIIGLSAHNKFEVADQAELAGMDALIEKPIKKDVLSSIVEFFSLSEA